MTNTIKSKVIEKITQQMYEIGFTHLVEEETKLIFFNNCQQVIEVPLIIIGE